MGLKLHVINGETIAMITLFGSNRHQEVTEWNHQVMAQHFGFPINYIEAPFPAVSHGFCMDRLLEQIVDSPNSPDYYFWIDNDCIALRKEAIELAYKQVQDKTSIWGHAWQSNHLNGPNGTIPHPYASQACLMFSRDVYNKLGRPSMDHDQPHCDTAEALTYAAKRAGYGVSLLYPSYSVVKDTSLDNGMKYGMGNTYGSLDRPLWHHTSSAPNPRHVEVFIETAKMVIDGAFDSDNPSKPYSYVV